MFLFVFFFNLYVYLEYSEESPRSIYAKLLTRKDMLILKNYLLLI